MRHRFVLLVAVLALAIGVPARSVVAREICFPNQSGVIACLVDPFASYWESNGGLPVFGYPIKAVGMAPQQAGSPGRLTQWTERARLELHPENPAPYQILMGRLGAERLTELGRDPSAQSRESGPIEGCMWFEETGHNVCDQAPGAGFMTYWRNHGLKIADLSAYDQSLQLFGLPLTPAQMETNSSGATVLTQWFERARFEWHPGNPVQYRVLLGLIGNEIGASRNIPSIFGFESEAGTIQATAGPASESGAAWARYNDIRWDTVEPAPGARNWAALARADSELQLLVAQGLTPIVTVRGTPSWAQQIPGSTCGPIKPEALDAFGAFMRELVARYSQAPYHVQFWELWNEPDADTGVAGSSPFGCWGDPQDPYYGGGYYAEMLKRVYPAIKQANPTAQVVLGGLLVDCDPDHPPAGKDCRSANFLEGVLRNGGGTAFDVLAYHGYAYWNRQRRDWDQSQGNWTARGGATVGKLSFLRAVLERYSIYKPIMLNEAALLCSSDCPFKEYNPDQANHVTRLYTRAQAQGLMAVIWFTFNGPGWRGGGLLDDAQKPRQGYQAYKFLAALLKDAQYISTSANGPLESYSFRKGMTIYQICWTNDGSVVSLPLPPNTATLYDKLGTSRALPEKGQTVDVGFEPVIIASNP
jgi:hypothetical protein